MKAFFSLSLCLPLSLSTTSITTNEISFSEHTLQIELRDDGFPNWFFFHFFFILFSFHFPSIVRCCCCCCCFTTLFIYNFFFHSRVLYVRANTCLQALTFFCYLNQNVLPFRADDDHNCEQKRDVWNEEEKPPKKERESEKVQL